MKKHWTALLRLLTGYKEAKGQLQNKSPYAFNEYTSVDAVCLLLADICQQGWHHISSKWLWGSTVDIYFCSNIPSSALFQHQKCLWSQFNMRGSSLACRPISKGFTKHFNWTEILDFLKGVLSSSSLEVDILVNNIFLPRIWKYWAAGWYFHTSASI